MSVFAFKPLEMLGCFSECFITNRVDQVFQVSFSFFLRQPAKKQKTKKQTNTFLLFRDNPVNLLKKDSLPKTEYFY